MLISGWAHILHAMYKPWGAGSVMYGLQHGSLFVTSFVFLMVSRKFVDLPALEPFFATCIDWLVLTTVTVLHLGVLLRLIITILQGLLFKVNSVDAEAPVYSAVTVVMLLLCTGFLVTWFVVAALHIVQSLKLSRFRTPVASEAKRRRVVNQNVRGGSSDRARASGKAMPVVESESRVNSSMVVGSLPVPAVRSSSDLDASTRLPAGTSTTDCQCNHREDLHNTPSRTISADSESDANLNVAAASAWTTVNPLRGQRVQRLMDTGSQSRLGATRRAGNSSASSNSEKLQW